MTSLSLIRFLKHTQKREEQTFLPLLYVPSKCPDAVASLLAAAAAQLFCERQTKLMKKFRLPSKFDKVI